MRSFKALVEAAEEDAREIGRLCRRRMSLDKAIRSLIDSAFRSGLDADTDGAFSHGLARRDVLCERPVKDLDALTQQVGDFEELYDRLEGLYDGASEPLEESLEVSRYPEYTTQGKMTSPFGLESDRFGQVRRQAWRAFSGSYKIQRRRTSNPIRNHDFERRL